MTACLPSSCGILVYNDETSIDARIQSFGKGVLSMRLMKSVVSLTYEGSPFIRGCSHLSTNCDKLSVTLPTLDTMGPIPTGFCESFSESRFLVLGSWFGWGKAMFLSSMPVV